LRNIESHAELPPLRHFTINRLERALRLVPGTIREHLNTGSPLEGMSQSAEESVQEQIALLLNTLQSKPAHARYGSHGKTHSIRLPDGMWARLKEQADNQGVPVSELIREALDQYLS
jgi:predicted DNA binding CopG/RHH family protein